MKIFDVFDDNRPMIGATNSAGQQVYFNVTFGNEFEGHKVTKTDNYTLNYNISSYTFQLYDEA